MRNLDNNTYLEEGFIGEGYLLWRQKVLYCNDLWGIDLFVLLTQAKWKPGVHSVWSSSDEQVSAALSQEGEQNDLMGRVDEGVDAFFSNKVTKMDTKKRPVKSDSQEGGETEEKKKRDSRKSGFLNLIKSRSSKSERPQTVAVSEEPTSPKSSVKGPAVEPTSPKSSVKGPAVEPISPKSSVKGPAVEPSKVKEVKPVFTDQNSSSDRSEELKTPDSMDEHSEDSLKGDSKPEGKCSPQGGRRYGVQVMGSGLLAEMKAKQEKRAAVSHKSHDSTSSTDQHDGSGSGMFA
ncbi:Leucine-rich repeat-containing protein 16A [Acipenser ruthenus]|uniref:Leucine-rich repeat-containing protein 16A n=1 Tax=Acipenser ruthenus TaxID=7906 RepID=A0A444V1M8_ACIRT|nr:Leucine-rich repeat-containing protein 16A [Acipenser ruthenus]